MRDYLAKDNRTNIVIANRESHMWQFDWQHLHLTLTNSKGRGQGQAHFG